MASDDPRRMSEFRLLEDAIPKPRQAVEHSSVAADDDLIESILHGCADPADPLARILMAWRDEVTRER